MSCAIIKARYTRILNNLLSLRLLSMPACLAAAVIFMAGCSPRQEPVPGTPANAVASVNGTVITDNDLDFEVKYYNSAFPEGDRRRIDSLSAKADYLKEEIIQRLLISQEAQRRGLEGEEEFKRLMEKTRQEILALLLLEQETSGSETSGGEAEEYYRGYKAGLSELEERHVREILLPTEKEAQSILIRLLQGEDFASLAEAYSRTESRDKGGDAGFLKRGKRSPEFDKAVFSPELHEGEISSVFSCPEGFYIVRIEAIRRFQGRPFEEMQGEIKAILLQKKKQERIKKLLQDLKNNAGLEIHEGRIK